jgi:TolB-like protein/tetratricopeptide (TPR) repeat protein
MEGESPKLASTPTGAVFLSYASQDAEAAQRICETFRAAGMEVWFDQSELRGGDVWDQKIRRQIHDCALFVPLISANTASRHEGYFRLEWDLADQRTHMMARDRAFIVPVCLDATPGAGTDVPESFHRVQWTRLPAGETPPAFVERVRRLLSPAQDHAPTAHPAALSVSDALTARRHVRGSSRAKRTLWVTVAVGVFAALGFFVADKSWISRHVTPSPAAFAPPPHSIAVLPFVNLSADKEQEYFSDGLTEELLNSLAAIEGLQVAARTSSFSFKEHPDIVTVAHKLNVGSVLEGSVRRSEHTVRVTAQLINAVTGFHLWSKTYDRDLGDVLKLQTEIATAVAGALKVTLLGDVAVKIELGGTRNPAAFDAYLRGLKLANIARAITPMECREPIDAFSEAIALDSNYALAYANRALITWDCVTNSTQWLHQINEDKARADAERAIALAPGLAAGHVALSWLESGLLNLRAADQACARALALAPGNDLVLYHCSLLAAYLGHPDAAISGARHGVELDPLNPLSHRALGDTLRYARRYDEAIAAYQASIAADPEHSAETYALRGLSYYLAGNLPLAQSSCEAKPDFFRSRVCRAVIYGRLGRQGDAAAVVAQITQQGGDAAAYQYAEIYTQWGERKAALDWLEKAVRLRDPGLVYTKTDPLLDPLRKESRFQAMLRELKFPD